MPNNRTFQAQALVINGVAVGGLATVNLAAAYANTIVSTPDGAVGAEDVDRSGLALAVTIDCTDVSKVAAIAAAAISSTTFVGKESGQATYHNYSLAGMVVTGFGTQFSDTADARLQIRGLVPFTAGTSDIDDMLVLAAAQVAPVLTYPARLYRPHASSFDPDGVGVAQLPLHTKALTLSMDAIVVTDFGDDDIGHTAVDVAGWNPLQVTLDHGDAIASAPSHIASQMLAAARGVLVVELKGRGGAADQTLTINNLLWTSMTQNEQAGYSRFVMTGSSGWRNGATVYSVNAASPLFLFA